MSRLLVLLSLACLTLASGASAQSPVDGARSAGDRLLPGVGNGGYDVGAYRVALRSDAHGRRLEATTEVDATATQDLRSLSLDLIGLRVHGVRLDGEDVAFRQTRRKLLVAPAGGLAAGRAFTLTVNYGGRPHALPDGIGWIRTRSGATVEGQPDGARTWFPNDDRPEDKATFDLTVDVPRGTQAIGGGDYAGTRVEGDRAIWRWTQDQPIPPYLATVSIGRFETRQSDSAGLPSFTAIDRTRGGLLGARPPRGPLRGAALRRTRALFADAGPTVRRLEGLFGPYPFDSVGGIYVRTLPHRDALETASRPTYYAQLDRRTQAHELAHQWVGDALTMRRTRDIWLHEGFATWAEWWEAQQRGGLSTAQVARFVAAIPERDEGELRELWQAAIPRRSADIFSGAVYFRGALTLEALRQRIGDATFRTLLRTWVAEHRYQSVDTRQFVALAERLSGQDLDAFIHQWLDVRGKPRLARALRR